MKTFLKFFFRVNMRNKTFMFLNTMGLAIGMAGFIMIMLWVVDEFSYDKYNKNESRIYRTIQFLTLNGIEKKAAVCPAPMAAVLRNEFPEVENVVRLRNYGNSIIQYGDKSFNENNIIYTDSTIFDVFTIQLVSGNPKTALAAPNSITLSESMAKKYFGDEDPIGKSFNLNNSSLYRITGVYKDIPLTSHFQFDFMASISSSNEGSRNTWLSNNFATYVLLKANTDPATFEKKLSILVDKYVAAEIEKVMGVTWAEVKKGGTSMEYKIQKLSDIHLHSNYIGELSVNGDIQYVFIFIIIAVFILVLACINFINLSTARATTRAKEVGMRKMFGAGRQKLASQFIFESFLLVFIAHIVAMIIVEISIPFFNNLSGKTLSINYFEPKMLFGLFGLIITVSLLAGSYPAFYLSSFKPISSIRSAMFSGRKKTTFRSSLVIIQFVISLVLLTSTLVLQKQMGFIQKKKLGYDKENLLVLKNTYLLGRNIEIFKSDMLKNPSIKSVTVSSFLPIPSNRSNSGVFKDGIKTENIVSFQTWRVDYDYVKTLKLNIIEGRDFSRDFSTDSSAIIINQAGAKAFGWQNPVGRTIGMPEYENQILKNHLYQVVGVVEDFNFESVHVPVIPLVLYISKDNGSITCRLNANTDVTTMIKFIDSLWKHHAPQQPFEYTFFDESLSRLYNSDERVGEILRTFTGMAFFISLLGLFGLALFTTEQRKREIGIRKVNGSTTTQIIGLLSYNFSKLVIIAFIIACPISFYVMSKWLENFAYRTNISWWIFAITGLLGYTIAMIAIGYQSYRAAAANPVDTLRNE